MVRRRSRWSSLLTEMSGMIVLKAGLKSLRCHGNSVFSTPTGSVGIWMGIKGRGKFVKTLHNNWGECNGPVAVKVCRAWLFRKRVSVRALETGGRRSTDPLISKQPKKQFSSSAPETLRSPAAAAASVVCNVL